MFPDSIAYDIRLIFAGYLSVVLLDYYYMKNIEKDKLLSIYSWTLA